eukprot:symbB.v1.2.040526.t1/scaffold7307.1/size12026/1
MLCASGRRCGHVLGVVTVTFVTWWWASSTFPGSKQITASILQAIREPDAAQATPGDWATSNDAMASMDNESGEGDDRGDAIAAPKDVGISDPNATPWHVIHVPHCAEDRKIIKHMQDKHIVCSHSRCILSTEKGYPKKAKAVVFNPLSMGPKVSIPREKPAGQIWVYSFYFESATLHQFAKRPTMNLESKIDLTMTYQATSDIFRPFQEFIPREEKPPNITWAAASKKYLLLWVVSNCGSKGRMAIFRKLQAKLGPEQVHIYGGCGKKIPCKRKNKTCEREFYSQYKFYAAFENSRCRGYITEKFFRGFENNMVPLAYGGLGRADYE